MSFDPFTVDHWTFTQSDLDDDLFTASLNLSSFLSEFRTKLTSLQDEAAEPVLADWLRNRGYTVKKEGDGDEF